MIDHVVLYKLKPGVDDLKLEEMVRSTRSILLKIPEILSVRSGRNVNQDSEWLFYLSIEVESLDKLAMAEDDAVYIRFLEKVIRPHTDAEHVFNFEMDPAKDLRYS
ncbi:MAG: hypothetical protein HKN82_18940 [Akkermansiaceae bacterium]|nr:hypothetical protein [Akkermansiaceae bacterium]NNM30308.1 hypothetical protein [Akkermansiaceae bacterium]